MAVPMKVKMGTGIDTVPEGVYRARLTQLREVTSKDFGLGCCWDFEILDGPCAKKSVGRVTSCDPTPKNAMGKFIAQMLAREPVKDEAIDLADFVGRTYMVFVSCEPGSEKCRVDRIMNLPAGS